MKIFDRYILKAHAGPLLFAFFTIMFVFILSFLTRFIDRLVGKGLDFGVLVELVLLQSSWMVGLALPMAVLVATVMAFGNLTNSSELTVMRSGGISMYRLVMPVLLASLLLSLFLERFNNVLLPEANYRANALLADITRTKPGLGIEADSFSDVVDGYSILARRVDGKSGEMFDVLLYDKAGGASKRVITASRGRIAFTPDYRNIVMTLEGGEIHELILPAKEKYRKMTFSRHRYIFPANDLGFERSDENSSRRSSRELSAADLLSRGDELRKKADELAVSVKNGTSGEENPEEALASARSEYNRVMVEYHKKYSLSLACLVFAVVGAPLGVMARRGGFGVGAGLSLLFFVLYWVMMIGGEKVADRGLLPPAISAWLPNILMFAVGLAMLFRISSSTGGSSR